MAFVYKLRCNIFGHEKDVRTLVPSIFPDGGIISGSRDVTARVWTQNEDDLAFHEAHRMGGHSNFIAAVCVSPGDDNYPHGLIYTGSNDACILAFTLDSPQHVFKLTGHSNTVCALATGKFGTLLSGSWDKTAKVWLNQKCVMTLEGHEAAIWAVAVIPEQGLMLTGSADKTVCMWKAGKVEKKFVGHEDCIRGLAVLSAMEFLSCANDATVRRWLFTGECVHVYYGHSNYIYDISVMPNGEDFVSCGEDRTLRVWRGKECVQTIAHPTQSVWSVCCLQNGDIVTGASDGMIRVFSEKPERQAPEEDQRAFEEQLAAATIPAQIGDIKMEDLPGPAALLNPGNREGQTKMVRDCNTVQLHQWDASAGKWTKIGDVVGSSGGSQQTSGKKLYEGKEYDYVFDVEIQEGAPTLQLPYDIAEDPWFAAQRFLEKNEISQLFLDQVANFIQDNVKGVTLGEVPPPTSADPFTGGGRYIPGSDSYAGARPMAGSGDPFTASGRYVPGQDHQPTTGGGVSDTFTGSSSYQSNGPSTTGQTPGNEYFPKTSHVFFESANIPQIMSKVKQFNVSLDAAHTLGQDQVSQLEQIVSNAASTPTHLETLDKCLQWPDDLVFPILDILRLSIRNEQICNHICKNTHRFINYLLHYLSADLPVANQLLSLRILVNLFSQSEGRQLLLKEMDTVLTASLNLKSSSNKNIQNSLATMLLNYAVLIRSGSYDDAKTNCIAAVSSALHSPTLDPDAAFRLCVSLGTLIMTDETCLAIAKSLDINDIVQGYCAVKEPVKLKQCAEYLATILA